MDKKILDKVFESGVFSPETKAALTEAFTETANAVRAEALVQARKEVAAEYKKNKAVMYETVEKYIGDRIAGPVGELREEAEKVRVLQGQYADKIVAVESEAKKELDARWKKLVAVLEALVTREITELHESEKINRRAYMKAINEAEMTVAKERKAFAEKASKVMENILDIRVQKHLDEHEADLRAAMKSDFGTEIFEAFYSTMQRHFFNTNKEAAKLAEALQKSESEKRKIVEATRKRLAEAEKKVALADASRTKIIESQARAAEMVKLLTPLKGAARDKMKALLEASPNVEAMRKTHQRFLPEVLSTTSVSAQTAQKPAKMLVDVRTGGATQVPPMVESAEIDEDELVDLRRRAGFGS